MAEIVMIDIPKLHLGANIRRFVDDTLAASIEAEGVLEPLHVYEEAGEYFVFHGHRRLAGAIKANAIQVPCVIVPKPGTETQLIKEQIIHNEERHSLDPLDVARGYFRLKELGMTQVQISREFGKSEAYVSTALATLSLSPKLQEAVASGKLSASAVEPLQSLSLDEQEELADAAIRAKTVKGVTALVNAHRERKENIFVDENSELPEDADPLEMLFISELEESLAHLQAAQSTSVQNPELKARGRRTVKQLVDAAKVITKQLEE